MWIHCLFAPPDPDPDIKLRVLMSEQRRNTIYKESSDGNPDPDPRHLLAT